jgi:hypothetical protein
MPADEANIFKRKKLTISRRLDMIRPLLHQARRIDKSNESSGRCFYWCIF